MAIIVRQPETPEEFEQYFDLRWRILRAPWGEPRGSEKDELEENSHHVVALDGTTVVGVARLQFNSGSEAQIRYMAVEPGFVRRGIGRMLVDALEQVAAANGGTRIVLDAREPAVGFYEKLGYTVTARSYLLFGEIRHFRMSKEITPPGGGHRHS